MGREKLNVAPRSGLPSAQVRPPCRSMMRRTLARPIPVPSKCRRAVQPLEDAEKLVAVVRVETDAVVAHKDHVLAAVTAHCRSRSRPGRAACELHRVVDQVGQYLAQHGGVARDFRQRPTFQRMTRPFSFRLYGLQRLVQQAAQIDGSKCISVRRPRENSSKSSISRPMRITACWMSGRYSSAAARIEALSFPDFRKRPTKPATCRRGARRSWLTE